MRKAIDALLQSESHREKDSAGSSLAAAWWLGGGGGLGWRRTKIAETGRKETLSTIEPGVEEKGVIRKRSEHSKFAAEANSENRTSRREWGWTGRHSAASNFY